MIPPRPPFRLVLTQAQSAALMESGIRFAIATTYPFDRSTLLLFECDEESANAAARVAQGTHRAVRKKPATAQPQRPARHDKKI